MSDRCGSCRFHGSETTGIPASPTVIICRRFPPSQPSRVVNEWRSPVVSASHWCGEYQAGGDPATVPQNRPVKPLVEVARRKRAVMVKS